MPSHRRRLTATFALSGLLAGSAISLACRAPGAGEASGDGAASAATAAEGGAEGGAGSADGRHPGLEAALAGLQGPTGTVPPAALVLLRESSDPAEQRAYRLLAIRGDVPNGAGGSVGVPAQGETANETGGGDADEGETPTTPVALVVSDAAAAEDREGADDAVTPSAGEAGAGAAGTDAASASVRPGESAGDVETDDPAASATAGTDTDSDTTSTGASSTKKKPSSPSKPKPVAGLTMITRIALNERGNDVELEIVAAGPLSVGSARGESEIRVIVEDAGALPAALQARPSAGDVRVTDVRRGDETVQIAVEIPSGWKVASKRSSSSGARVRFAAR